MEVRGRHNNTIAELVAKNQTSTIQDTVNDLVAKSDDIKFQLNESQCKEMRISFSKKEAEFAPISIKGKAIEVLSSVNRLA